VGLDEIVVGSVLVASLVDDVCLSPQYCHSHDCVCHPHNCMIKSPTYGIPTAMQIPTRPQRGGVG
jgi:hypothetical protein